MVDQLKAATMWKLLSVVGLAALVETTPVLVEASAAAPADIADRLIKAYPGIVTRVDSNLVVFADGTTLPLDDGKGVKRLADWLAAPDIEDMFRQTYPAGTAATPPPADFDPGRARNAAFFAHIYGDCRRGEVKKNLVQVAWLPKKYGRVISVSSRNGMAEKLKAVSAELDALAPTFDKYLFPIGGTDNCRVIAGTSAASAHSYGIAIDIGVLHAHYWRWSASGHDGAITYKNEIPAEIIAAFEKHGFIWGGRWHHYDTMHFEYRPELIGSEPMGSGPAAPVPDQPK
jgi:D-alanyl-D-alanine carboxypeptidase